VSAAAPVTAADFVQMLARDLTNNDLELPTRPEAVVQMGFKLLQSSAISFALRQLERNEGLSEEARKALKEIWKESVELAARSFVIAKHYTKLNAEEAMLAGLLSVLGRLYIFMKSIEYPDISYSELDEVLREWHPAIAKAIAETWNMSDELANALENQLHTDLPVEEKATIAEILISARLIYQHELAEQPLDGTLFPILQRLGICAADDTETSLEEHQAQIENIRNALMK
jgi:HD-like signal output (HDOD) protein